MYFSVQAENGKETETETLKKNPYFSYILGNGTFESKALN